MNYDPVIIIPMLPDGYDLKHMEGKTYQVHVKPDGRLQLYEVTINKCLIRCPCIIHGTGTSEQCALEVGHTGKHMWGRGD